MKIYDAEMKNEISELDFGELEIGKSKILKFYLFNENSSIASVTLKADKVSLTVTTAVLRSKEKLLIEAKWISMFSLKESLRTTIEIEGREIYV